MAHLAGKNGGVYTGALLVEDCEDTWAEKVDADVTETADTDCKAGTYSAKFACGANLGAGDIVATEAITKDLTAYDILYAWVKSSVAMDADDWQILLDDTAQCASPTKTLNLPALSAATWTLVALDLGDTSGCASLISIGLKQIVDKGAMDFYIDDVWALAVVEGIKSWSLDYEYEALESTDFEDDGVRAYVAGASGWSGSYEGLKDGVPLSIGSSVKLILAESTTAGQNWIGDVYITAVHPEVSFDGTVNYSYDFTGTGALEVASV